MEKLKFVHWDLDAARLAIKALKSAAQKIEQAVDGRARAAHIAKEQWEGPARELYDEYINWVIREERRLVQEYYAAAELIKRKSAEAIALNDELKREHDAQQREARLRGPR